MADDTLRDFVKEALLKGQSRDDIARALETAGWPADQTKDALAAYADVDFPIPVPKPRRFGGAREAFLYIVFFALLGMVAVQVGRLSFALVDHIFADALTYQWSSHPSNSLRWSIASLVVGYPIFLYLGWRLGAARRKDPERRISRVRAWLTYVTLIFAALTLIGDFVAIVYNFLGGEIQARFLAKALVVGVISGAILFNYTRDAERTSARIDIAGRVLAIATTLVVAALLLWAFLRVDTPAEARARGFDEQRLNDMMLIVRRVDCYRTYFDETPETLEAMNEALDERASRRPVAPDCRMPSPDDPVTGASYRYDRLDGDRFRLCAVFARGWPDLEDNNARRTVPNYGYGPNAQRRALKKPAAPGETCFTLEAIDFEPDDEDREPAGADPGEPED